MLYVRIESIDRKQEEEVIFLREAAGGGGGKLRIRMIRMLQTRIEEPW